MSTEVSEAAVEEVSGALTRNFASFSSQQWVDTAAALVKAGGNQAAAQLAPGETVEWLTPGIVHRNGKAWPEAILLVTPHRLIVSASRGSIRTKREISSLYRGPESLMSVTHRLLPGTSADHWTLEIATQQGPFLFAIPNFTGADALAQITGAFIARRAQYTPEAGITLDGAPWGTHVPAQRSAPSDEGDPIEAAKADLGPVPEEYPTETGQYAAPVLSEPTAPSFWSPAEPAASTPPPLFTPTAGYVDQPAAVDPGPPTETFDPFEDFGTPPEPEPEPAPEQSFWQPVVPAEPELVIAEPEPEAAAPEPEPVVAESDASLPAADWYVDPLGEARLRYWDGQAWTHSTAS